MKSWAQPLRNWCIPISYPQAPRRQTLGTANRPFQTSLGNRANSAEIPTAAPRRLVWLRLSPGSIVEIPSAAHAGGLLGTDWWGNSHANSQPNVFCKARKRRDNSVWEFGYLKTSLLSTLTDHVSRLRPNPSFNLEKSSPRTLCSLRKKYLIKQGLTGGPGGTRTPNQAVMSRRL